MIVRVTRYVTFERGTWVRREYRKGAAAGFDRKSRVGQGSDEGSCGAIDGDGQGQYGWWQAA
jgi:hypothetical protein